MDEILAKASSQAVTFAIRSGISIASGYAIKTVSSFLEKIPEAQKQKLAAAQRRIQTKSDVLAVSIDLIRLVAARGNTLLEPVVALTNELSEQIDAFNETVKSISETFTGKNERESIAGVERNMADLLEHINDAIPLINLALITSGASLKGSLPSEISPGRLLQASNHVNRAHEAKKAAVGPVFDVVLYTIFYNPSRLKYIKDDPKSDNDPLLSISWKEEFARSLASVVRNGNSDFSYALRITEDLNDGRYHDDDKLQVKNYSVKDITRLFFSASGKLLRLDARSAPVLILKVENGESEEWVALGEVNANEFDDSDSEEEEEEEGEEKEETVAQIAKESSLSLLEYILRLSALQENDQKSILDINDERLALYLRDENNTTNPVPKSAKEKLREAERNERNEESLAHQSNVSRLGNLELK